LNIVDDSGFNAMQQPRKRTKEIDIRYIHLKSVVWTLTHRDLADSITVRLQQSGLLNRNHL